MFGPEFLYHPFLRLNYVSLPLTRPFLGHDKCDDTVNDKRPVNLDIGTIDLPVTALVSILHRASGMVLVAGVALLLWLLDASLASEESFNAIAEVTDSFLVKLLIWAVLAALIYHTVVGIKHLIHDMGIGETLEAGTAASKMALVISIALIVLTGALIW